eukprot:3184505-Prorocentrum_lima.AAC.1
MGARTYGRCRGCSCVCGVIIAGCPGLWAMMVHECVCACGWRNEGEVSCAGTRACGWGFAWR